MSSLLNSIVPQLIILSYSPLIVMHLSYEETVPFKLLCLKGNVEAVDASPHSYNIALDINRNIIKGETY